MRILADTHVVVWMLASPDMLSATARDLLDDATNTVLISSISIWEIGIKHALQRRDSPPFPALEALRLLETIDVELIDFGPQHAALINAVQRHHGDPFDHALVTQARHEGVPILSRDAMLKTYGIEVLPA